MIKELKDWIIDNYGLHTWDSFIKNATIDSYPVSYTDAKRNTLLIVMAFNWKLTDEGVIFWGLLNLKWVEYCKELNK